MTRFARDIPGLVWGYRFARAGAVPVEFTAKDDGQPVGDGGFRWIHLALSDARVPAFLAKLPGLPDAALQTLNGRDDHPCLDVDDGVLHGVIVDFQRTFDQETRELGWMRFALGPDYLVTTRLQPLRSVDRARSVISQSVRMREPADLLETIVSEFVRTLHSLVAELSDEMNVIEDFVYDDAPRDERRRLGPVRRILARLHRHLRGLFAAFRKVEIMAIDEAPDDIRAVAERLADKIEKVNHDVFGLQERARLLHDEIDNKISSETNRHLYLLSVMTAFMLPPTLVAGIFGMNTGDLPFVDMVGGTWYAVSLCALSAALAWYLLRRAGIL